MTKQPLVSVVLSFRNEEEVLTELIARLQKVLSSLPLDHELIFVNDASTDGSLALLMERAKEDQRIKIISMSRRFGVSECSLVGLKYASGDAVVYMDTDLQDPPEAIPGLIEKWREGADVVHTVRTSRKGESVIKLALTKAAYGLIGLVSDIPLIVDAGDFKLLSRRVVDELLRLPEKDPYLRGLVSWVGFKQVSVPYERQERSAGRTHFPLFRNVFRDLCALHGPVGTLVRGLTSFSIAPLVVFLLTGLVLSLGGFCALVVLIVLRLCTEIGLPSWSITVLAVLILSGVQLLGVGVLGLYLARVYNEVRGRPRHIVAGTYGFEKDEQRSG